MTDPERLLVRIAELEAQTRSAFEDAQRQADALFAQYQLSQLLASGGLPVALGEAVLVELTRLADADGGVIWLGESGRSGLVRIASVGTFSDQPPDRLEGVASARGWASGFEDITILVLGEEAPATRIVVPDDPRTAVSR